MGFRALVASIMVLGLLVVTIGASSVLAADEPDPTIPQELSGKAGLDFADLSWFKPVLGPYLLENYSVYRGSGPEDMSRIANVSANISAYHDGELTEGSFYYYYVTAWYDGIESGPSNAISVTTGTQPEKENLVSMGVVLAIIISAIALQMAVVAIWVLVRKGSK